MPTVKVSSKHRIVIPRKVRQELQIQPGEELHIYVLDGRIHLSRIRPVTELHGMAKGLVWKDTYRDHSERFSLGAVLDPLRSRR